MGVCNHCMTKRGKIVASDLEASQAFGELNETLVITQRADLQKPRGPLFSPSSQPPSEQLRGKLVKDRPSPTEAQRLLVVLQSHFILKHLSLASQTDIISQLKLYQIKAHQVIVQQGDPGDYFFITHRGEAEVLVNNIQSHSLPVNSSFGDMALLADALRSATVRSISKCWYWVLDRTRFKNAVQRVNELHFTANLEVLNHLQLFEGFDTDQKEYMLQFFTSQQWEPGQVIVKEGDQGSMLYIITEGVVDCTWRGKPLRRLGRGDVFGEQALLNFSIRTATVTAVTQVCLLSVSAENLRECFGENLEQVIYNNTMRIAFKNSAVLSGLSHEQVGSLIEAMSIRTCEENEVIAVNGAPLGECLWVVLKGALVYGQEETKAFHCIGDEQLITNKSGVFECDLRARSGAIIAEITVQLIESILGSQLKSIKKQNKVQNLLKAVPLFKNLPKDKLALLALNLVKNKYTQGTVITEEGSLGDTFYIITSGVVHIQKGETTLRTMEATSFFGERALLTTETRSASVVAATNLVCWTLQKHAFLQLLDPKVLQQLTRRMILQDDSIQLSELGVVKVLGSGMSAQVLLTKHREKGCFYAVKVVEKAKLVEQGLQRAICNERDILQLLDHPMVLKLVKAYDDDHRIYFLGEFVQGLDLFDALRVVGSVSEVQAKFFVACLILVFEHLHSKKVVYRDLKPENVMVDEEGYLKLIDFGAAKKLSGRTYTTIGTPHYMAPEAIIGTGYDFAVDFWSLGVMVYEFLYGDVPFGRDLEEPTLVYQEILANKLIFPKNRTFPRANKFIECLLNMKPHLRGSIRTLKAHNWLTGTDWEGLWARNVKPSFTPEVLSLDAAETVPMQTFLNIDLAKVNCWETKF